MKKLLLAEDGKVFFVRNTNVDYHCQFGLISKEDLQKKEGSTILTNTKKKLQILPAQFVDKLGKIKRSPQIIPQKDLGAIIAITGINKESKVVDAGAGSGSLACFLAHVVKEVTSYEIREDFFAIAKENAKELQLTNLTIKHKDVCQGIAEKNVDLVTLDMPNPWDAVEGAAKALKVGGFLVSYSPTIPQVVDLVEKLDKFGMVKTIEIIEREWEINGRKTRPKSQQIGHSGFLTFARKITL